MVNIEKSGSNFVFEIQGLHKLWAFKSQLTIPAEHIIKAYPNENKWTGVFGLRMPGTMVPGLITAGTFLVTDGTIFCDIVHPSKAIVVELEHEHYDRLVIEVEDPAAAIELLSNK